MDDIIVYAISEPYDKDKQNKNFFIKNGKITFPQDHFYPLRSLSLHPIIDGKDIVRYNYSQIGFDIKKSNLNIIVSGHRDTMTFNAKDYINSKVKQGYNKLGFIYLGKTSINSLRQEIINRYLRLNNFRKKNKNIVKQLNNLVSELNRNYNQQQRNEIQNKMEDIYKKPEIKSIFEKFNPLNEISNQNDNQFNYENFKLNVYGVKQNVYDDNAKINYLPVLQTKKIKSDIDIKNNSELEIKDDTQPFLLIENDKISITYNEVVADNNTLYVDRMFITEQFLDKLKEEKVNKNDEQYDNIVKMIAKIHIENFPTATIRVIDEEKQTFKFVEVKTFISTYVENEKDKQELLQKLKQAIKAKQPKRKSQKIQFQKKQKLLYKQLRNLENQRKYHRNQIN